MFLALGIFTTEGETKQW